MNHSLLIRVDASVQIGTGHVMRCLTLADELRGRGTEVIFVCREFDENLCGYIEEKGYIVHRLPVSDTPKQNIESGLKHAAWLGADWQTDARQVEEIIKDFDTPPDWLVVDQYALDERWEGYLRPYCRKIMVIDDLADRAHDCDLLLDQNFYENLESRYDGLVPARCKKLLGPKYALLRPEFREARKNMGKRDGHVKRIMIFFGGSDPTNETTKALEAISMLNRLDIAVDVVVGAFFIPHRKVIEQVASDLPDCTCHFNVEDMAALMAGADLAVGAGGTTVWERCALAIPSLVTSVAENQEKTISDMAESGYLLFLGRSEEVSVNSLYHALEIALQSPWLLISFAQKAWSLVDGQGASRTIRIMRASDIVLRPVQKDDCTLLWEWASESEVRAASFSSEPIPWDQHVNWFNSKMSEENCIFYVAVNDEGTPVGQVRFDRESDEAVISVTVDNRYRGLGLGSLLIRKASQRLFDVTKISRIHAYIKRDNDASKRTFLNAGYEETSKEIVQGHEAIQFTLTKR